MRSVCFKIDEHDLQLIDEYARNHVMSRSDVIRNSLQKIIEEEREKRKAVEELLKRP